MLRSKIVLFVFLFCAIAVGDVYIWAMKKPVDHPLFGSIFDHTYTCVGSSGNAYTFPSWSSNSGGNPAVGGYGNQNRAECYAGLSSANMEYYWDGFCHQYSNRVLYAASQTLDMAGVRGYSTTTYLRGVYGYNWDWIRDDCNEYYPEAKFYTTEDLEKSNEERYKEDPEFRQDLLNGLAEGGSNLQYRSDFYSRKIYELAQIQLKRENKDDIQNTLEQFDVFVDCFLGIDFPEKRRKVIQEKQRTMLLKLSLLKEAYDDKEVNSEYFNKKSKTIFQQGIKKVADVLSDKEFEILFQLKKEDLK